LYERTGPGKIRLKPGIGYCLRRFYPLVQQLARSHWIDHIKGNSKNVNILGPADDLEAFLFASSRQSLELVGNGLRKLYGAKCFYCGHNLTEADVDHFIPFSHYPRDLAHNFVLAHPSCNRSKSDTLAALIHLERWAERLHCHASELEEIGSDAGIVAEPAVTKRVGAWAYANAVAAGSQGWVAANRYSPLDNRCSECFI
jgi:5-methylcytosine-specific restriction endonuclease McrA